MTYAEKYLIDSKYLDINYFKAEKSRSYFEWLGSCYDLDYIYFTLYNKHYKNLYCKVAFDLNTLFDCWFSKVSLESTIKHHFKTQDYLEWKCENYKSDININRDIDFHDNLQCDCKGDATNE